MLFRTHLDAVPVGAGARPLLRGRRVTPSGPTALGGDNRTGVACLVTMVETLLTRKLPHPPLTILFTVREESGLWGARFVKVEELGHPVMGFNVDGGKPTEITIGAVGAERWQVAVTGKASHAGAHPEHGISATIAVSLALAEIHKDGWFGKIKKKTGEGTSNIGSIGDAFDGCAGQATNVIRFRPGSRRSRSHDPQFVRTITRAYKTAFQDAAKKVANHKGKTPRSSSDKARLSPVPFETRCRRCKRLP